MPNKDLTSLPLNLFFDFGVPGSLLYSENVPFEGVLTRLAARAL